MTNIFYIGTLALGCTLLAGCQTSSTMGHGQIQAYGNNPAQSVSFQITENLFDPNSAQASARLVSGEVFSGKIVVETQQTQKSTTNWDASIWDKDDKKNKDQDFPQYVDTDSTTYSSDAKGVLFSNSRSMQCRMTLSNPMDGFSSGGVGQCKLSTGETVPVQF